MICAICGGEFTPAKYHRSTQVCCTPECSREHQRRAMQKWTADHREWLKKYQHERHLRLYAADPEHFKQKSREWRLAHPDKLRAYHREYQRRQRGDPEFVARKREVYAKWYARNAEKVRTRKRKGPLPVRACVVCSRKFIPRSVRHICCTRECSEIDQRQKGRVNSRQRGEAQAELLRQKSREYYWKDVERNREKKRLRLKTERAELQRLRRQRGGKRKKMAERDRRIVELSQIPGRNGRRKFSSGKIAQKMHMTRGAVEQVLRRARRAEST